MLHSWSVSIDGNGGSTRVMLFDSRKAFDLIDHHLLLQKLKTYDLPQWTIDWIKDFLTCRNSPWLFTIMINDLVIPTSDMWKFVDDSTLSEAIKKGDTTYIQNEIDQFTI
jgi:hypothetical protein